MFQITIDESVNVRIRLVDVQLLTFMTHPQNGKHVLLASNAKGELIERLLPEGAQLTIHVGKSKEPKHKAA